jgi:hypothetical protein
VTAETREFWETWADNKAAREPDAKPVGEPDAAAAAEERTEPGERSERREKSERSDRRGRERSRGRDQSDKREKREKKDEERSSRARRDTSVDEAPPSNAADGNQARLFVSLGKKHGVSAEDLRTLLAGPVGGDTSRIGSVSLRDSHAHVRVPEELVEAIIAGVHGTLHKDHNVTVERARA